MEELLIAIGFLEFIDNLPELELIGGSGESTSTCCASGTK